MEALEKLYELACERGCAKAAKATGKECSDFATCEECVDAVLQEADSLFKEVGKRLMPEGMEWPVFEDGEPVRIGDEVLGKHGEPMAVTRVCFVEGGCYFNESHRKDGRRRGRGWRYVAGERVKRPKPADTQERIDADAAKTPCEYFGWSGIMCDENGGCPAREMVGSCELVKIKDLLRRQHELDARKAGA